MFLPFFMFLAESYYSQKNCRCFSFTVISCRGHVLLLITTLFPTEAWASITQSNILATTFRLRQKLIFYVRVLLYWIY